MVLVPPVAFVARDVFAAAALALPVTFAAQDVFAVVALAAPEAFVAQDGPGCCVALLHLYYPALHAASGYLA